MNKEVRQLIREMTRKGWAFSRRKSNHVQLTHPSGRFVVTSSTPSDGRTNNNVRAAIRRIEKRMEGI